MEGPPKRKTSLTEAAVLSVGLLAAHPEAQALEMPTHAPWHIGIEDHVRKAVARDKVEHSIAYVKFTDHSSEWVPPTRGTLFGVTPNFDVDYVHIQRQQRHREIDVLCQIHTHQQEILKEKYGPKARTMYNPPSGTDMVYAHNVALKYKERGVDPRKVQFAVADPRGLWYFGSSPDQLKNMATVHTQQLPPIERKPENNALAYAVLSFIEKSTRDTFSLEAELPKLQLAYKLYTEGNVRFVSYKDITKEPACAGVNYRP